MRPSSDDRRLLVWFCWNSFLCMQCPKISLFFFFFNSKMAQICGWVVFLVSKVYTLSQPGANGFPFLTIFHLMFKSMFLFCNSQTWSLSVVEVLLCSNLKDDLCKLNLVLNEHKSFFFHTEVLHIFTDLDVYLSNSGCFQSA